MQQSASHPLLVAKDTCASESLLTHNVENNTINILRNTVSHNLERMELFALYIP